MGKYIGDLPGVTEEHFDFVCQERPRDSLLKCMQLRLNHDMVIDVHRTNTAQTVT